MNLAKPAPRVSPLPFAFLLTLSLIFCVVGLQLDLAQAAEVPITLISVTSPAAPFSDATLTVSTTHRQTAQSSCTTSQGRRGPRVSSRRYPAAWAERVGPGVLAPTRSRVGGPSW